MREGEAVKKEFHISFVIRRHPSIHFSLRDGKITSARGKSGKWQMAKAIVVR